jgi:hypothetical protein
VAVAAEAGLVILALLAVLDGAATAAGILAGTAFLIAVQLAVDVAIAGGAVAAAWRARETVIDEDWRPRESPPAPGAVRDGTV